MSEEKVVHSAMNYAPEEIEYRAELLLCHIYPNYLWSVEINLATGHMEILNFSISKNNGMVINMHVRRTASELEKLIKMYGGELLERANLPRKGSSDDLAIALASAEREMNFGQTLLTLDKS